MLWGDRSHDFGQPLGQVFGGNVAINDGQPWVRTVGSNREWQVPLLLQPRPALTQYTNLVPNPSFEVDTTGWAPNVARCNAGATLTRVTTQNAVGAAALQVVTTIAASAEGADSQQNIAMVSGQPVSAVVHVKGNAGGELLTLVLGDGTVGQATQAITCTTAWQRITVSLTPTATGLSGLAVRTQSATALTFFLDAVQVTRSASAQTYIDGAQPGCSWSGTAHNSSSLSPVGPVNTCSNPSFEVDTSGWSSSNVLLNGTSTLARTSAQAVAGSAALSVVVDGSNSAQGVAHAMSNGFIAGTTYVLAVYLKGSVGGETVTGQFGASGGVGTFTATLTTSWQRFTCTWTPAATVAAANVAIFSAQNITFYVDAVQVVQASGAVAYFDGDSLDADWTGTPHASTSTTLTGTDGLHQMVQDLGTALSQGALVRFQPQGASNSTYFDLERGQVDEHWDLYEDTAGVLRTTLRLYTRPYGHTGTTRLVASTIGTGPQVVAATGILGDVSAFGRLTTVATAGAGGVIATPMLMWGAFSNPSFIPVRTPAMWAALATTIGATVIGASGVVGSQYQHSFALPNATAVGGLTVLQETLSASHYAGRHRLLMVARATSATPSSLSAHYTQWLIASTIQRAIGYGPTALVPISTQWSVLDLGEFQIPKFDSRALSGRATYTLRVALNSGSFSGTGVVDINALIFVPADITSGLVLQPPSLASIAATAINVDSYPNVTANFGGATQPDIDGVIPRGDPPNVQPVGSQSSPSSVYFVVITGDAANFVGNSPVQVSLSARERFSYLR